MVLKVRAQMAEKPMKTDSSLGFDSMNTGSSTNVHWLGRLKDSSDTVAWEWFVERYAPRIRTWARQIGIQEADASDIAASIILKLLIGMKHFEYNPQKGRFRGWLRAVTRNAVWDMFKNRASSKVSETADELLVDDNFVDSLVDELRNQYELDLLTKAESIVKKRVKPNTWKTYYLTYRKNLTTAQAAKEIGIGADLVHAYRRRVSKLIRKEVRRIDPSIFD